MITDMESSAPTKPPPLHNFDLPNPNLKWNITDGNSSSIHHRRRSTKSPSPRPNLPSASPIRQSPPRDSVSAPPPPPLECYRGRHSSPDMEASRKDKSTHSRNSVSSGSIRICSSGTEKVKDKIEEKSKAAEEGDVGGIKKSKILIKIPRINNTKPEVENNPTPKIVVNNDNKHDGLTEETRAWNLRPRNPKCKSKNGIVDPEKTEKAAQPQLKNINKSGEKKKEKKKLSVCISLSKEEIEEDIYALTGSKPSRKPKKRARNVQKKVDTVFPGLWLVSISPDSYKVSENSMKG